MSAVREKYLLCILSALAIASPQPARAQGLGELGMALGATANTITSLNQQSQLDAYNRQLLQQLNSQEAQVIQQNIKAAQMEVSTLISNTLLTCLQQSSVSTKDSKGKYATLGQGSCKKPRLDLSVFEQELTCSNAQSAESVASDEKKYEDCRGEQLRLLQGVVNCFDGFDQKLKTATEKLQGFLSQRTSYMKQVLNTFNNNIDGHKRSMSLIDEEMEGPDGYKAQVQSLDDMDKALKNALTQQMPVEFDGNKMGGDLVQRVQRLGDSDIVDAANQMYFAIVGPMRQCYSNGATTCDTSTGALPNGACLAKLACIGLARGNGYDARCKHNQEVLANISRDMATQDQFNMRPFGGNLNPYDPNSIIAAAATERDRMEAMILSSFDKYQSVGLQQGLSGPNVAGQLREKIHDQIERCFNLHSRLFAEQYNTHSSQSPVWQSLNNLRQKQVALEGELSNWMELVTDRMTKFMTKFTNTFSSTLKQFSSDCSSSSAGVAVNAVDAQGGAARAKQMLACLQTLEQRLKNGLDGTNGEAPTIIQVPVINGTPGAVGANTQVLQQQCTGFKDCIQKLTVAKKLHKQQVDTLTSQRQAQAQQHNQLIEGILDQTGSALRMAMAPNGAFMMMLGRVNKLLSSNGIAAQLNLKAREDTESLELDDKSSDDEKSRIYKAPKDILSAIAGRSGIAMIKQDDVARIQQKIDDQFSGSGGINEKSAKADRVLGKARDKLRRCTPNAEDYASIKNLLGNCEDIQRYCGRGISSTLSQFESIGSIIANDQNDGRNSGLNRRERNMDSYSRCMKDIQTDDKLSTQDLLFASTMGKLGDLKTARQNPLKKVNDEFQCYDETIGTIRQLYSQSRDDYRRRHGALLDAMEKLIGACESYRLEYTTQMQDSQESTDLIAEKAKADFKKCSDNDKSGGLNDWVGKYNQFVQAVMSADIPVNDEPPGKDANPKPPLSKAELAKLKINLENYLKVKGVDAKTMIAAGSTPNLDAALKNFFDPPEHQDPKYSFFDDFLGYSMAWRKMSIANYPSVKKKTDAISSTDVQNREEYYQKYRYVVGQLKKQYDENYKETFQQLADNARNLGSSNNACKAEAQTVLTGLSKEGRDLASKINHDFDKDAEPKCQEVLNQANKLAAQAKGDKNRGSDDPLFDGKPGE